MRLVLVGPPGAGKGTQAEFISARCGVPAISTGDLFRNNVAAGTPLGIEAKRYLEAGNLVPDEVTINMVAVRLDSSDAAKGFLLDGFPRTIPQAETLNDLLKVRGAELDVVIELALDDSEVVRRLVGRRTCRGCGKIWHIEFDPTADPAVCDRCGGDLYIRDDDQPDTVRQRLDVYAQQTAPIIGFYASAGKLITVDAGGPVEEVTAALLKALQPWCPSAGG